MNNFKAAVRTLLSTPGPTLVVIVTLAIAIGGNTAIFSVVNGVLLRSFGYGDDSRLVVLWSSHDDNNFRVSPADYRDVRDEVAAFDGEVALTRYIGSTLTGLETPVRVGSMAVTPRLFRVLEARPALGRLFGPEDDTPGGPANIVITHASWTRRFGADPDIIGTTIEVDGTPRVIAGVAEPDFQYPPGDGEVEVYMPMALDNRVLPDRNHRMFDALARLDDGVSIASAREELTAIAARLADEFPASNTGWSFAVQPLRRELLGDLTTTLWVLSSAVFAVLLIACANIANLLVARSAVAEREFSVRAALGADRADLCRRSVAETMVLGGVGAGAGCFLAYGGVALLRSVVPSDIPRADMIGIDAPTLAFAAVVSIGATVLFGFLPAWRSMRPDLSLLLNGSGSATASGGSRRLREAMVVAQVALAVVLLASAGLMARSFARLTDVDPGFRSDGVVAIAVQLPSSRYRTAEWKPFFEQLVERVRALRGVRAAGAASDLPMSAVGLGFELDFRVEGAEAWLPTARANADFRLVVPGYFEAMGMPIVDGRGVEALDAQRDRRVAVVNQTLVDRYFPQVDPIGRTISIDAGDLEIIGVVADVKHGGLLAMYESEVYIPFGQPVSTEQLHVVVQSDLDAALVAALVGDVIEEMDPELAPSPAVAISDLVWESVAQPRFNTALLSILAGCGALLAAVGTYGIVAYSVGRRAREIGVRMALGADAASTVTMIVRHALGIVIAGAILGIVAALAVTPLLRGMLFETEPTDPLTYVVVLAAALSIGLLAAWTPARRATRIDPISSLRSE